MLRSKDTTIISEINIFFTSNAKICQTILRIIRSLNLITANNCGHLIVIAQLIPPVMF